MNQVGHHVLTRLRLACANVRDDVVLQLAHLPCIIDHLLARLHPANLRQQRGRPAGDFLGPDFTEIEASGFCRVLSVATP